MLAPAKSFFVDEIYSLAVVRQPMLRAWIA